MTHPRSTLASALAPVPQDPDLEPPPAAAPGATQVPGAPPGADTPAAEGAALLAPALGLAGCLVMAAVYSCLSASLIRTLPSTVDAARRDPETGDELRRHLGQELEKTERLATSASLAAFVLRAAAAVCLFLLVARGTGWTGIEGVAATAVLGGLWLHLFTQSLPLALARWRAEGFLAHALPPLALSLGPFALGVSMLTWLRQPILRVLRIRDADHGARRLVEGFRAIVEESALGGDLKEDTRELIANVIDFGEVDAAEVMTPRTEIRAVEKDAGLAEAVKVFAASGFSRIPVYAETIDSIIGTLTALEAAKAVAEGRLETTPITAVMRPPLRVPETKMVADLLTDFRAQRQKMAIVVDEYGGTAGLVTLADVMAEILGEVDDEYASEDTSFVTTETGAVIADATLHVSEVNEELDLEIPEEADYETLAGFVLSELGRIPSRGDRFEACGARFLVTEASDRRVLRVEVDPGPAWRQRRLAAEGAPAAVPAAQGADPRRIVRHSQAS